MRHGVLKPDGTLMTYDLKADRPQEMDTVQCAHCGRHWVVQPGSGRRRGICGRCGGITCGSQACDKCVPLEQLLTNIEQGKPLDHQPILVASGWEG